MEFFNGFGSAELVGLALAGLFGAFPGLKLFSWLKGKLGWEDEAAHTLVLVVSLFITGGAMVIASELSLEGFEFSLANILEYGGVLYAASQIAFKRLNL